MLSCPSNTQQNHLDKYILRPDEHPQEVVFYNNDIVVVKDKIPKAQAHYLVMPRDEAISNLHPYEALSDPGIVGFLTPYVNRTVENAAAELGVDKSRIWTGCHAVPSEKALHVHVISIDFVAEGLNSVHRYLVFTTDFFVRFGEMPKYNHLTEELGKQLREISYTNTPYCVHCGKAMGNIQDIKAHLDTEYQAYKNKYQN